MEGYIDSLLRRMADEEVLKIFDKVYKKRGNLFVSERKWLRDNITYFQEKERKNVRIIKKSQPQG
ncbi:TPA: hypothetical protein R0D49_004429 [Bacillus cereus]|nr:hypothetical protein [Bacillus cereus]